MALENDAEPKGEEDSDGALVPPPYSWFDGNQQQHNQQQKTPEQRRKQGEGRGMEDASTQSPPEAVPVSGASARVYLTAVGNERQTSERSNPIEEHGFERERGLQDEPSMRQIIPDSNRRLVVDCERARSDAWVDRSHTDPDEVSNQDTTEEEKVGDDDSKYSRTSPRGQSGMSDRYDGEDKDTYLDKTQPSQLSSVGTPQRAPSWRELSSQIVPAAAREILSTSVHRFLYTARISYAKGRWHRLYSDLGNPLAGYYRTPFNDDNKANLPPFSTLPWVDRQLVREWRTIESFDGQRVPIDQERNGIDPYNDNDTNDDDCHDDAQFNQARTLVPRPLSPPRWEKADYCHECRIPFGPTKLRHHCRMCGKSFCQSHSNQTHKLPHLGYDPNVPERVCLACKSLLEKQTMTERVAVS